MAHFITKAMPIGYIDSKIYNYKQTEKAVAKICVIDFSGFLSSKRFFIAWGQAGRQAGRQADTHTRTHAHAHTHTHIT